MATAVQQEIVVVPFGIEADHPRNCDLLIQSIPGCRLRSAISGQRSTVDWKTGDEKVPVDQSRHLAGLPRIPGMQLHINPAKLTYMIIDPLLKDEVMCERIEKFLKQSQAFRSDSKVRGVPTKSGPLDVHRMKTLCRELFNIVASNEAHVVMGGVMPTLEDIDELPGYYLLNPGSVVQNTQPTYEKDWEGWVQSLSHSGG